MRSLSARTFSITYPKDAFDPFTIDPQERENRHHGHQHKEREHIKSYYLPIIEKSPKPILKNNSQLPKITKRICGKTNRQEYIKAIASLCTNGYDSTRAIAHGLQEGGYKCPPEIYEVLPEIVKVEVPKLSVLQHPSMYDVLFIERCKYTIDAVSPEIIVTKRTTRYSSNQEWTRKTSSLVQPAENSSYYLSEPVK